MDGPLARVEIEGEGAEARPVGNEHPRDVLVLLDPDAELVALAGNGPHDRASREVARVAGPPPAVGAEEAPVQPAVFRTRELASPGGQLEHGIGRLARHDL